MKVEKSIVDPVIDFLMPLPAIDPDTVPDPVKLNFNEIVDNTITTEQVIITITKGVITEIGTVGMAVVLDATQNQVIEIDPVGDDNCIANIDACADTGFTITINVNFVKLQDGMVILSTGGEREDSNGISMVYEFGQFHVTISTVTFTWKVSFNVIKLNIWAKFDITWDATSGVGVYINDNFIIRNAIASKREKTIMTTIKSKLRIGQASVEVPGLKPCHMKVDFIRMFKVTREILIKSNTIEAGKNKFNMCLTIIV